MHCPRCGKENPEDANFCMHCGADLREYKVEISPKIEVSPKIKVSPEIEVKPTIKKCEELSIFSNQKTHTEVLAYKQVRKPKVREHLVLEETGEVLPVYLELNDSDDPWNTPLRYARASCPKCGGYRVMKFLDEAKILTGRKRKERDLWDIVDYYEFEWYLLYECTTCGYRCLEYQGTQWDDCYLFSLLPKLNLRRLRRK